MTHNLLRCELWLDTLSDRVDYCLELFRYGLDTKALEGLWMAIFFVWRECS